MSCDMIRKPTGREVHTEHPPFDESLAAVQREDAGEKRRADEEPADHRCRLRSEEHRFLEVLPEIARGRGPARTKARESRQTSRPEHPDTNNVTKPPRGQPRTTPIMAPTRLHHQTWRGNLAMTARYRAPSAPIAADSVAVVMPNKITASTTTVSTPSGTTDTTNSFKISSWSPSMRQ